MFKENIVSDCLYGLAGLRQNNNPDYPYLDSGVLYSGTNRLIHHPLVNIENIDQVSKNFDHYDFPVWAVGDTYNLGTPFGDRVRHSNKVWETLIDANTGITPSDTATEWKEINLMSLYLEDVFRNASSTVVNDMFTTKKIRKDTKSLLEDVRLFEGAGRITNKEIKKGRLVGFQIVLKRQQNLNMVIEKIGTQLDTAQGDLDLYLYHSSQLAPVATITINGSQAVSFEWHTPTAITSVNSAHDVGGAFYLMYNENDLLGQAIIKDNFDFSKRPCGTCSGYNIKAWNLYNKFFTVTPITVAPKDRMTGTTQDNNGISLWDISKHNIHYTSNFGMNIEVSIKCDVSDFICAQKDIFADVLAKQIKVDLLNEMVNTTRDNAIEEKVKKLAKFELQDRSVGGGGLMKELEKAKTAIDFDMSDLSSVCLPCVNTGRGIKYSSVGV